MRKRHVQITTVFSAPPHRRAADQDDRSPAPEPTLVRGSYQVITVGIAANASPHIGTPTTIVTSIAATHALPYPIAP